MRVFLITPPMAQVNTPYPATAFLCGFLRSKGIACEQDDLSLKLFLKLFSKPSLAQLVNELREKKSQGETRAKTLTRAGELFLANEQAILRWIDPVIEFLQGKAPNLAYALSLGDWLPTGVTSEQTFSNYEAAGAEAGVEGQLTWAFGALGITDRARHLATLFIDDLAEVYRCEVDSRFGLSRYGEKLSASQADFSRIMSELDAFTANPNFIERSLMGLVEEALERVKPDFLALTVPFPGNLLGALQIAAHAKRLNPKLVIAMGGGFVNTELRDLTDQRLFQFIDYLSFDDGEIPLYQLITDSVQLVRTATKSVTVSEALKSQGAASVTTRNVEFSLKNFSGPSYVGLPLSEYVGLFELLNPMHRLWSEVRWNKIMVAHGCYWKKCRFCDTTLDYISRYEPAEAVGLVDQVERLIGETGSRGFHLVDEAAPPALLKAFSSEVNRRNLALSWWGNLRFEKSFTPALCQELARSGCIAVTGGLEVASDRLLKLMNKGVSIESVARVTKAFTDSGILVHAYLMYGFPTQTEQETIDSLELVRQLFEAGCLQSAYWHRFSATAHSEIGQNPTEFKIHLLPVEVPSAGLFARNDLVFEDATQVDHDRLGKGLNKALYNYMHGMGLDEDVRHWFEFKAPKSLVPKKRIQMALPSN